VPLVHLEAATVERLDARRVDDETDDELVRELLNVSTTQSLASGAGDGAG
jgi:hypothetical protein